MASRHQGSGPDSPAPAALWTRRQALGRTAALAGAATLLGGSRSVARSETEALAGLRYPSPLPPSLTAPWNAGALPGPYGAPAAGERPLRAFASSERIVATYYFYWYDVTSGLHTHGACGALSLQPPTLQGFSTFNPAWHAQQLTDMHDAGIDIALPVYWGDTGSLGWSQVGLERMVVALAALERAGMPHPQIGMFFDTSSLQAEYGAPVDITVDPGRTMFLNYVRSFYSLVPPRFRALIDGRPVVWLYSAAFVSHYDDAALRAFAAGFSASFGAEPYMVREVSWCFPSDNVYAWGAASAGPTFFGVLEVGPGFNNTALSCEKHLIVHRDNGAFYRNSWEQALAHTGYDRRHNLAAVETWNELHEGTAVCATRQYGRQYITLTRYYADIFHRRGPAPARDRYTDAPMVSYTFGQPAQAHGLTLVQAPDGPVAVARVAGRWAGVAQPNAYNSGYVYFLADHGFAYDTDATFTARVTYWDRGTGSFSLQYDSTLDSAPRCGAYATASPPAVALTDSGTWRTATFTLPHARLAGRENAGADLRLTVPGPGFAVGALVLARA